MSSEDVSSLKTELEDAQRCRFELMTDCTDLLLNRHAEDMEQNHAQEKAITRLAHSVGRVVVGYRPSLSSS